MEKSRKEQVDGTGVAKLRAEILEASSELRPFIERHRDRIEGAFHTTLSDEQWEQFCHLAMEKLIPGLLIGNMRGLRVGLRGRYAEEHPEYAPKTIAEAISWLKTKSYFPHDLFHITSQIYRHGTLAPAFQSGNATDGRNVPETLPIRHPVRRELPSWIERYVPQSLLPDSHIPIDLPFKYRRLLTPSVIHDEFYAVLFGAQQVPVIDFDDAGKLRVVDKKQCSLALAAHQEGFHRYTVYKKSLTENAFVDPFLVRIYYRLYAVHSEIYYSGGAVQMDNERNRRVFSELAMMYPYNQTFGDIQEKGSDYETHTFRHVAPVLFQEAARTVPEELWRLFDYIDGNTQKIVNGGPQLFDLFMAMGNMDTKWLAEQNLLPDRLRETA